MKVLFFNTYKKYFSTSNFELVPSRMRAILQNGVGDSSTLYIGETEVPVKKHFIYRSSKTRLKF